MLWLGFIENVGNTIAPLMSFFKIELFVESYVYMKTKVLIVTDYSYPAGGIEVFLDEIIHNTQNLNFEYKILTWQPSRGTAPRTSLVDTIRIECGQMEAAMDCLDWSDLVFYQASWNIRAFSIILLELIQLKKKPLVSVFHTSESSSEVCKHTKEMTSIVSKIVDKSDSVIAVSNTVALSLKKEFPSKCDKFCIIPNAPRFADLKDTKGKSNIGFIGRPFFAKGYDIMQEVMVNLEKFDFNFLINTVSMPAPNGAKFVRNGAEYSFLLSDEELKKWYQQIDLLVVPYRKADGLSLAVLEAINCGIDVISTPSKSLEDLIGESYKNLTQSFCAREISQSILAWRAGDLDLSTSNIVLPSRNWSEVSRRYEEIFINAIRKN